VDLTAFIDCPSCSNPYEGQWHIDVIDIEQLDAAPEAEQACPACGEVSVETYPGWTEFGGAG
jgi:hypothetical protein